MNNLGMKLLPDTLYNWLEIYLEFWDQYSMKTEPGPLGIFFKQKVEGSGGTNQKMKLIEISQGEINLYRKVM